MPKRITQKNQPPRPQGGLLVLLIVLVFMSIALVAMFIARMGNPTTAKAAERPSMAVTVQQHLPYLLYNYSRQEVLLPPTAELTPTTALTDGVSLKPGMTLDVNFPPQISSKIGDVGGFNADYYLGVIELVGRETVWPYWHVRLYAGEDKFDGYMLEPAIYSAVTGKAVFILPQAFYRVQVKPDTRVNVRLSPVNGEVMGVITNRAVDYGVIGYTVVGRRLWLQLRNPELGSWSMGFAAAEFFDRIIVKPSLPAEVSLDLVKTEGTAVNVRSAAGAAAPIIGKIINPLIRYEAQGGVLRGGTEYWHKIVNPHYVAGDPRDGWRDGYVLAVYFIVH